MGLSGFILLLFALNPVFSRPVSGYFQQQVDYHIQVGLLTELNRLECRQEITYHNHSPDTLLHLFFHLYINRYKPVIPTKLNSAGYQEIISLQDESGTELKYEIAGTLLKVLLLQPVFPADSTRLIIRFNTVLPEASDRFGYYGDHYDVGNWYPTPVVYNQQGWQTSQHIDGEFFQEWADFRVDLTVPQGFVVGATGVMLNPEVLPDSLLFSERKRIYNYHDDSSRVTYHFSAPRVHDFAWCADPEFVLRETKVDSTTLTFLILPYRLKEWEVQIEIAGQAFKFMTERIGPYPYSNLTIVDGYINAGGIEYPNLVIINDMISEPEELSATIIHEIAHQWFYGILANNQTRYGWMDEGFATFFEREAMNHVYGTERSYIESPTGFWGKWFGYWEDRRQLDRYFYQRYMRRQEQEPINRHFDWFQGNPYIPSYQKMSLVIDQLKLVGGDSLFWKGITAYYQSWKYRHPDPEDLFSVFENTYQQKLDWFFDEWLNTIWTCDYALRHFSGKWIQGDSLYYQAEIRFQRKQPIVMPLDFRISYHDGTRRDFRIEIDDGINFRPPDDYPITPWPFYEKGKVVSLRLPKKVEKIELNPDQQLLDINPFNDSSERPKIYFYWLNRQYYRPKVDGYTVTLLPFAFYNQLDGLQIGLRTRGTFIPPDYQHRLNLYLGLLSFKPDIEFWFEHPLYSLHRDIHILTTVYNGTGQRGSGLWLQWEVDQDRKVQNFLAGWQWRYLYESEYLPYPVSSGNISFLELAYKQGWWQAGFLPSGWEFQLNSETSFLGSDYPYHQWSAGGLARFPLILSQKATVQLFTGGQAGEIPQQKAFRLGGAATYDFYRNPFLRAKGSLPSSWWEQGHIFEAGGGNLAARANDWQQAGNNILNGHLAITLGNPVNLTYMYIPYLSDLLLSVYTSWSSSSDQRGNFSTFYGEGGLTLSLTRLPFVLNYFDIQQVHFDFPVWVNNELSTTNVDFRWAMRLEFRSFY